jgi:hypothetical protein
MDLKAGFESVFKGISKPRKILGLRVKAVLPLQPPPAAPAPRQASAQAAARQPAGRARRARRRAPDAGRRLALRTALLALGVLYQLVTGLQKKNAFLWPVIKNKKNLFLPPGWQWQLSGGGRLALAVGVKCWMSFFVSRGAVKKKMTKATYICRSAKKKVLTYLFLFLFLFLFFIEFFKGVFWAFRNKGSSKTRKKLYFEKVHLGSSHAAFFSSVFFFSPSVVLFDFFFIAFLGVS